MEADALTAVGHDGFMTDAEAMAALLYELATRPGYLALVQKEFAGIKASFGDYQQALAKTYIVPSAPEPK